MRTVLIGGILVLFLALAGLAVSQSMSPPLKSVPVYMTVTSNQEVGVYGNPESDTQMSAWYANQIRRGDSLELPIWIKALGEPVDIVITVNGPDWVSVTPDTLSLSPGAMTECTVNLAPPFTADLGDVTATIEIKVGS